MTIMIKNYHNGCDDHEWKSQMFSVMAQEIDHDNYDKNYHNGCEDHEKQLNSYS